ncbi:hypothetical protein D3C72_1830180 [compost metagenome]
MLHAGGARDGNDVIALVQQPRQRQLRGCAAHVMRNSSVAVQQLQIGSIGIGRKTRHGAADVLGV